MYFTCALASVNRAPFDLAEAESELVAGFHTEYSGIRWSYFFMAEFGSMFAVSGLATILFFGGWNGPVPITSWIGLTDANGPIAGYIGNFLGLVNFVGKTSLFVIVMIWIRWSLPRLRIDQVMKMCLKFCVPIAAVMFLGATFWQFQFPGGVVFKTAYGDRYKVTATDKAAAAMPNDAAKPEAKTAGEASPAKPSADKTAAVSHRVTKGS